jgi:hypothetical protein
VLDGSAVQYKKQSKKTPKFENVLEIHIYLERKRERERENSVLSRGATFIGERLQLSM